MPRLFAMRFGRELGKHVTFRTSNGRLFYGNFKSSKSAISGLKSLMKAYDVYHNCILLFEYVGSSMFNVLVFDSQNMDLLKEVTGEYIADIVRDMLNNEGEFVNGSEEILETINVPEVNMLEAEIDHVNANEIAGISLQL